MSHPQDLNLSEVSFVPTPMYSRNDTTSDEFNVTPPCMLYQEGTSPNRNLNSAGNNLDLIAPWSSNHMPHLCVSLCKTHKVTNPAAQLRVLAAHAVSRLLHSATGVPGERAQRGVARVDGDPLDARLRQSRTAAGRRDRGGGAGMARAAR